MRTGHMSRVSGPSCEVRHDDNEDGERFELLYITVAADSRINVTMQKRCLC